MRGLGKNNILSVFLTVLVVGLVIFSGPASAVTVYVAASDTSANAADSTIIFTVEVDMTSGERIPVQNLTLRILDSSSSVVDTCIFDPSGNNLTACTNMSITQIRAQNYTNGTLYGYGYSPTAGYTNKSFGTGFGYGYASGYNYGGTYGSELEYNVTWNLTKASPSDGNYTADVRVETQQGAISYTFSTISSTGSGTIQVDQTTPTVTAGSSSVTATTATLTATTSENVTCKYASSNLSYANMSAMSTTGTTSHSQSLTGLSASTSYTYYVKCRDGLANEGSGSTSFTTSSAGGGEVTTTTPVVETPSTEEGKEEVSASVSTVVGGDVVTIDFTGLSGDAATAVEATGVEEIKITLKETKTSVKVTVKNLGKEKTTEIETLEKTTKAEKLEKVVVTKEEKVVNGEKVTEQKAAEVKVYKYIQITSGGFIDTDLKENPKVKFKTEKSWIVANNIDKNKVNLNRFADNKWNKLPTTLVSEDDTHISYEAETEGFSYFAVTGETVAKVTTTPVTPTEPTPTPTPTPTPSPPSVVPGVAADQLPYTVAGIVILIIIIIAVVYFLRKK